MTRRSGSAKRVCNTNANPYTHMQSNNPPFKSSKHPLPPFVSDPIQSSAHHYHHHPHAHSPQFGSASTSSMNATTLFASTRWNAGMAPPRTPPPPALPRLLFRPRIPPRRCEGPEGAAAAPTPSCCCWAADWGKKHPGAPCAPPVAPCCCWSRASSLSASSSDWLDDDAADEDKAALTLALAMLLLLPPPLPAPAPPPCDTVVAVGALALAGAVWRRAAAAAAAASRRPVVG